MGMSVLTALTIQGNGDDIVCEACRERKKGAKWAGMISLFRGHGRDRHLHTMLLSSEPIYNFSWTAKAAMKKLVAKIRATDFLKR